MKYAIDAKFVKGQPHLRVLDAETGKIHLEWSLTRVHQMLEEGEIDKEDFLHPERYGMHLLIKNLFLLSCIESCDESSLTASRPALDHQKSSSDWAFSIKFKPI